MKSVLVTGHTGFIGSAVTTRLKESGCMVVGIERDRKGLKSDLPDIVVQGDIRDHDLVRRVLADYEIEEIYHFAAQAIVSTSANDPYTTYDFNVMGTVALLEAVRVVGEKVKSIVVSTSDKAFGHAPIPYTHKTPLNPLYTYEASKACQHIISLSYYHNYNLPTKVIASSNAYGPGDPNLSRVIPKTITRLAKGEPAIIFEGAAEYVREFVYINDVVDAFITVTNAGLPGELYCCGGTEHCSMVDLISRICELMGKNPEVDIVKKSKSKLFKEIDKQWIDSTKLRSLGWKPKVSLDSGLRNTIDYYTATTNVSKAK